MAPSEHWTKGFFKRHTARHHREDWPVGEAGVVFFQGWTYAFDARGIGALHAERASLELVDDPPRFLADHLPRLVKLALELRRRDEEPVVRAPLPAPEEDPEALAEALADLKALVAPLAASKGSDGPVHAPRPRRRQGGAPGALQWPPQVKADPVIARELAPPPPPPPPPAPDPAEEYGWI